MLQTVPGLPTTLSASWVEPEPANGVISNYTINCTSQSGSMLEVDIINPEERSTELTDLDAYTEYTCVISATTGAGRGDFSNPQVATTAEDGEH